jgi:hypothetical protein
MRSLAVVALASLAALAAAPVEIVQAHPGGLAADGCHNDRKNGGRHCHGKAKAEPAAKPQRARSGGSTYYANCAAARAAGAAPVRRGDPGYSSKLDRDGDGIGCE